MKIFMNFRYFETEKQAKSFCNMLNSKSRFYQRVSRNATYRKCVNGGKEQYVCSYYT